MQGKGHKFKSAERKVQAKSHDFDWDSNAEFLDIKWVPPKQIVDLLLIF
jgi:hypothetical protein